MTRYKLILADPPWGGEKSGFGRIREHYPLMTVEQIQNLALPIQELADDDCILMMWAIWTHLQIAMDTINAWGFEYQIGFPWIKVQKEPIVDMFGELRARPVWGMGKWVRGCSEPVLVATRGNPVLNDDHHMVGLLSERFEHSRKPDNIYDLAESMTDGPYLELFARRTREGWDAWGNEIDGIELEVINNDDGSEAP